jgi:DNA-binding NarL/FixJ family response regulator
MRRHAAETRRVELQGRRPGVISRIQNGDDGSPCGGPPRTPAHKNDIMKEPDRFTVGAVLTALRPSIVPHDQPFMTPVTRPPIQVRLVAPSIVCWGLQLMVQTAGPRLRLVGSSATLADALPVLEWLPPDVVVVDIDDGCDLDGLASACAKLRLNVLVLTGNTDRGFVQRMMAAGARGVQQKRDPPSAFLKAIEVVGRGHLSVPQPGISPPQHSVRGRYDAYDRIALLTDRERQTIAAVVTDVSAPAKVIAARLKITEHTLRNHLTSIYSKLDVSGRLALYAFAKERRLIRMSGADTDLGP